MCYETMCSAQPLAETLERMIATVCHFQEGGAGSGGVYGGGIDKGGSVACRTGAGWGVHMRSISLAKRLVMLISIEMVDAAAYSRTRGRAYMQHADVFKNFNTKC